MAQMLYQGHGSYRLTTNSGTVIYVDPFAGEGYDVPADIVIVTHDHPDHREVNKMPHSSDCLVFWPQDFLPAPGDYKQLFVPEPRSEKPRGVRMSAVQAYNKNHPIDECVGVVIEFDGISFYAAGDTSTTEDMTSGKLRNMMIDYATFPADGFYNMDVDEASKCAELVDAIYSIPVHLVPVHDPNDATIFSRERAEAFQAPGRVILEPGEVLQLEIAGR